LLAFGVMERLMARIGTRLTLKDSAVDPMAVGAQVLNVLDGGRPAMWIVDDVQWADDESLRTLMFVIRRLVAERLLLVLVHRDESGSQLPRSVRRGLADPEVAEISLTGLSHTDVLALAAVSGRSGLTVAGARTLCAHTSGNPLYTLAMLSELSPEELTGESASLLPAPRTYTATVLARLRRCSANSIQLIQSVAVLGPRCTVQAAIALSGVSDAAQSLDELHDAGLIDAVTVAGQIRFTHPLVRSTVYHDLSAEHRSELHRAAAAMADSEAQAMHHAVASTFGYNAALSRALLAFGGREVGLAHWASAAHAFLSAAQLSNVPAESDQMMMQGAECLMLAGESSAALALLPRVSAAAQSPRRDQLLGFAALISGERAQAHALLAQAWQASGDPTDHPVAAKAAWQLSMLALTQGEAQDSISWAHRSLELERSLTSRGMTWATLATAHGELGQLDAGIAQLPSLPKDAGAYDPETLGALLGRGVLHLYTGNPEASAADLTLADEIARTGLGPFSHRVNTLLHLADAEYRLGRWDRATTHAELASSLADASGEVWAAGLAHAIAAFPASGRGEWAAAQAHIAAADRQASRHQDPATRFYVSVARARLEMARENYPEVLRAVATIEAMNRTDGVDEPGLQPWKGLHAEALVKLERPVEAEAVLGDLIQTATVRGNRRALMRAHRIRALARLCRGDFDGANHAFEQAIGNAEPTDRSLEHAKLLLDYGQMLKAAHGMEDALTYLHRARDALRFLGAEPYLLRCQAVLTQVGEVPAKGIHDPRTQLTKQELAVAMLVTAGLTNRQAADELVVSPKTIEYHLSNIYRKLQVSSRTMLAARLAEPAIS
ncbi:MAG: LuxR C-terminal-related transcriptional regulator, partial [Jatrophihabitantaceae bacterium]